ncbi:MAG: hypothetical protein LBB50_02775 [Oscillospiraceae bacterium]|nr:hypothetical protein [Oscillospiraceae bacterium]
MKKTKTSTKVVALLLALVATLTLLAGCEINLEDPDRTTAEAFVSVPKKLTQEEIEKALAAINATQPADATRSADEIVQGLDESQQKLLQSELAKQGYDVTVDNKAGVQVNVPNGVTVPATTKSPVTQPPTLPQGTKVNASEVYPYLKATVDTLRSGTFYFKGKASSMAGLGAAETPLSGAGSYAPMAMAIDAGKAMIETEADWTSAFQNTNGGNDYGQAKITGAIMQTALGNKLRMIFSEEGSYWAFPQKKVYIDLAALMGDQTSGLDDINEIANSINPAGDLTEVPKDVPSSKVKVDGKEYLCATLQGTKYYYLDGALKRMEVSVGEAPMVMEIEEFSGKPDASLFSVKGYRKMPVTEFMKLFQGMSSIFE